VKIEIKIQIEFLLPHQVQAVQPKNFNRNPHFYYHQVQAVHPKILNKFLTELGQMSHLSFDNEK